MDLLYWHVKEDRNGKCISVEIAILIWTMWGFFCFCFFPETDSQTLADVRRVHRSFIPTTDMLVLSEDLSFL